LFAIYGGDALVVVKLSRYKEVMEYEDNIRTMKN
jgi:hypothetical protein